MAENQLEIVVSLVDKATKELQDSLKDIKRETDSLKDSSGKATKTLQEGLKDVTKSARDFHQTIAPVVLVIATVIATTKSWSESNKETKAAFDRINTSVKDLSKVLGSIFAPAIIELSKVIQQSTVYLVSFFEKIREGYKKTAESITFATQFWVAFFASIKAGSNITDATADSLKIAEQAAQEMSNTFQNSFTENLPNIERVSKEIKEQADYLRDLNLQYIDGKLSSQDYYDALLNYQNESIRLRQVQAEGIQQIVEMQSSHHMQTLNHIAEVANNLNSSLQNAVSGPLANLISGTKSAKEAFSDMGKNAINVITKFIAETIVAATIGQALLKVSTAFSIVQAKILENAWRPAAVFASIATGGGAAGAGAAGIISAFGVAKAASMIGAIQPRAQGGDDIVTKPTLFLAGEAGPERATFSPLGGRNFHGASTINIYIQKADLSSQSSVEQTAEILGFAIERSQRSARGI